MPAKLILNNALLDEFDVFRNYQDRFVQADSLQEQHGIYGINLVELCREEIRTLEEQFLEDGELPPPKPHSHYLTMSLP